MSAVTSIRTGFAAFPELSVQSSDQPQLRLVDGNGSELLAAPPQFTRGFITTPEHATGSVEVRLTEKQLFITFVPHEQAGMLPPRLDDRMIIEAAERFLVEKGRDPAQTEIVLEVKPLPSADSGNWPTEW